MKVTKITFKMLWEVNMNKIFVFLLALIFLPAFAACPIDSDKPCTGNTTDKENKFFSQQSTQKDFANKKSENYSSIKINPKTETKKEENPQNYDPDCMFGICLP